MSLEENLHSDIEMVLGRLDSLYKRTKHLRYGQLFLNIMPYKDPMSRLYHEVNNGKAREQIRQLLLEYQNTETLDLAIDLAEDREKIERDRENKTKSH